MLNCPACNGRLLEKNVAGMTLDVCYGGCGGIWFDASELERVDVRSAATLHTVWRRDGGERAVEGPRRCPRCTDRTMDRKWFSSMQKVEIDQCPSCAGLWLDDGELGRGVDGRESESTGAGRPCGSRVREHERSKSGRATCAACAGSSRTRFMIAFHELDSFWAVIHKRDRASYDRRKCREPSARTARPPINCTTSSVR
jgi:Zn-finger nucleic acid-binding protein